jgi:2-polyprenyl-3-methyl-5-hydroxy-6-metoxy-1,4-benzoquinol methylase
MNPQVLPDEMKALYPPDYGPHQARPRTKEGDLERFRRKVQAAPVLQIIRRELSPARRLLDAGCGTGAFLNDMKLLTGCEVYGVDVSNVAASTAKQDYGLSIFAGSVHEAPFASGYLDVITAWSYLEHVNDPSKVLARFCDLLRPNGCCVIQTPNADSFNARLFKEKWYHLDCPRHLYIYTPKTVTKLLEKSGLSVERIFYEKTSKGILGSLQYSFYGDNYNPKHRDRLRKSSLLKTVVSPLSRIAALLRRSDVIVVLSRKH